MPQVEQGEEVGARLREALVHGVGRLSGVRWPFPRVLDGQRGRDDQHLADAPVVVGLQDHPAEARVHRQPGQLPPYAGESGATAPSTAGRHRAQFFQQPYAVGDVAGVRRVHEREVCDVAEVER